MKELFFFMLNGGFDDSKKEKKKPGDVRHRGRKRLRKQI